MCQSVQNIICMGRITFSLLRVFMLKIKTESCLLIGHDCFNHLKVFRSKGDHTGILPLLNISAIIGKISLMLENEQFAHFRA